MMKASSRNYRRIFVTGLLVFSHASVFAFGLYTHKTRPAWYVELRQWMAPATYQQQYFNKWMIPAHELAPVAKNVPENLDVYVLAGQSNMSGGDGSKKPDWLEERGDVFVFGYQDKWRVGRPPVHMEPPLTRQNEGFGPGLVYGNLLAKKTRRPVGLVPCALGGTPIIHWETSLSPDTLFGSCLRKAKAASRKGQVRAMFFHHGEADANDLSGFARTGEWGDRFQRLVTDFRSGLGQPSLPVVFAQIGMTPPSSDRRSVGWKAVQDQQAAIDMSCVGMVKTDDLLYGEGLGVHLDVETFPVLAERVASRLSSLLESGCESHSGATQN